MFALFSPPSLQVAQYLRNRLSLKCSLFQVVEVWHARAGWADEAVPVLACFGCHLLWVRVSLGPSQSRRVPRGLHLTGVSIRSLPGHGLSRSSSSSSSNVAPWLDKASSFVWETHVWCSGFAGGGRGREMKKLAKRPERLVLVGDSRQSQQIIYG